MGLGRVSPVTPKCHMTALERFSVMQPPVQIFLAPGDRIRQVPLY